MSNEYLLMFLEESQEHLQSLNDNVLVLENNPGDIGVVGEIFRSAHTFKGMSATMGFTDIAELTHEMENVLDLIRHLKMKVTSDVIDVIFECIDNLEKMVIDIQSGGKGFLNVTSTVLRLKHLQEGDTPSSNIKTSSDSASSLSLPDIDASHEVKVTLRHDCLLKGVRVIMVMDALSDIGEIIATEPSMEVLEKEDFGQVFTVYLLSSKADEEIQMQPLKVSEIESVIVQHIHSSNELKVPFTKDLYVHTEADLVNNSAAQKAPTKIENKSIRVNLEKIEQLMNMFEESVIERGRIEEIVHKVGDTHLEERIQRLASISKDLQNLVLNMRMVPVETVFNRFPRMIRQLAKDLGKDINLVITGEETEIDRIVIDEIGDPLVHLIRNSVDHGIETQEERTKTNKDKIGTVTLNAYHSGNNVVIEISDDGRGINRKRVLEKAIQSGILSIAEGQKLTDTQIYDLILEPGFSTADIISDISGRGVGLDVVKTTITKLGGTILVKSEEGKGSTFRIELPLTLSIIQSMLITANNRRYAVPLGNIVETMHLHKDDVQNIHGKDVMNYREKTIQIISLSDFLHQKQLDVDEKHISKDTLQVVILKSNDRTFAISVNEILGQREIVLKSLGNFFTDGTAYFSGATILGDGKVVLILDCDKLKY